ncbi:pkb-activating kinase-like protein [Agyrium rufum]|nr:pkb-activating kinase-like protein [Agyrium rufum]
MAAVKGDLSLSQSFGGLRIANPDDASNSSIASPKSSDSFAIASPSPISQPLSKEVSASSQLPATSPPSESSRPLSTLDFDPNSFSTADTKLEKTASQDKHSPTTTKNPSIFDSKRKNRESIPYTYQAQQAQFQQYSTPAPQAEPATNTVARPLSSAYGRQASNSTSSSSSYRTNKDAAGSAANGLPRRTSSRGASSAMQAGVPSREGSYSDRTYRNGSQPHTGNGPLPPRKSSKGMTGVPPLQNGGSTGSTRQSGSPYGIEGGPLSSSAEWQDRGAAMGVRQELDAEGRPVQKFIKKGVKDFHFGRTLGEGSYSTVLAATDRQTLKEYAIKVLDKRHIIKEKKVKYVNIERDTLNRLTDHPGVVRLYYTFQDERSLYFVLDLASGGELLGVLKKMTSFDMECTRFYGAQILDTIAYMHSRGVIHRDLKPENVLLDDQMHVKITDFGTAKILKLPTKSANGMTEPGIPTSSDSRPEDEESKANSFVGTAEYVSPELLTEKSACKASDLWAFGCIIYQLLVGRPPFKAGNEYQTFQKIVNLEYKFPPGFPPLAQDLVERLLVLDPARRLSIEHIKNHEFFDGIPWGRGLWRQKAPRLRPYVAPVPGSENTNRSTLQPATTNGFNGSSTNVAAISNVENSYPPDITASHSTRAVNLREEKTMNRQAPLQRPTPRVITELPPPSQLDIEWSPVLTRNNERILKLGNLLVLSAPGTHSPPSKQNSSANGTSDMEPQSSHHSGGSKFSRFFGGGTTKKRPRLVMVTSSARVIMAAPGGDEKKAKLEISLLTAGTSWRKMQDPKGLGYWILDTRDKHFTFEAPNSSSSDGSTTASAAQDWIDAIEHAREIALSQSMQNSYSGSDVFQSAMNSPSGTLNTLNMSSDRRKGGGGGGGAMDSRETLAGVNGGGGGGGGGGGNGSRNTLRKEHGEEYHLFASGMMGGGAGRDRTEGERGFGMGAGGNGNAGGSVGSGSTPKGFKRFSKRGSKNGLAAVF